MKNFKELIKYGICGGVTTAINLLLFFMFTEYGIYYLVSNAIAYYIAVIINYYLNYYLVFERINESKKSNLKKLAHFCVLRTSSLILDTILFFVMVDVLGFQKYIIRVILSFSIILLNFLWSKRYIFIEKGN